MREIPRLTGLTGRVTAPSSKSYTNRALLLACMTEGNTRIVNALDCDDARFLLEAIRTIGFEVSGKFADGIVIGERVGISANEVELYVGNAGTAMRFLAGFLAFTPGRFILKGDERMQERPIGDLVDALRTLGTEVEYLDREGYPPLQMRGRLVRGGFEVEVSGAISSQFVSALMMGAAKLPGGIRLRVTALSSRPYIDMTRDILRTFGASVEEAPGGWIVVRAPKLSLAEYDVEGDFSSASYWFAAGAVLGGPVTVDRLKSSSAQGDAAFLGLLERMGATVSWSGDSVTVSSAGPLRGGSFDCNAMPDVVPTLAAIAPLATSAVEITNVANLRVKESDRIAAVATELRKLGATVDEGEDWLRVHPGWNDSAAVVDPHNDHRLAMAFAIAGLARGGVSVDNESVVSKSYPRFWRTLDELGGSSR